MDDSCPSAPFLVLSLVASSKRIAPYIAARRDAACPLLACPRCGGRLWVIATVQDPLAVQAILAHLGLSGAADLPGPAPSAPAASA